jgi:hypothetical protein
MKRFTVGRPTKKGHVNCNHIYDNQHPFGKPNPILRVLGMPDDCSLETIKAAVECSSRADEAYGYSVKYAEYIAQLLNDNPTQFYTLPKGSEMPVELDEWIARAKKAEKELSRLKSAFSVFGDLLKG